MKRLIALLFLGAFAGVVGCGSGSTTEAKPQPGKVLDLPKGKGKVQGAAVEQYDTVPPPPESLRKK